MTYNAFIQMNGKDVVINGVPSKMLISKLGRSTNEQVVQYRRQGRCLLADEVKCGDLIEEGDTIYLVLASRKEEGAIYAILGICNAEVGIQYFTEKHDEYGNPEFDEYGNPVAEWVSRGSTWGHQMFVSARMRVEDPGILHTTICTFHIPATQECYELDRAVVNGAKTYQVDTIDDISAPGLKILQVSTDER